MNPESAPPPPLVPPVSPVPPEKKHSGLGIASLIIGVIGGLSLLVLIFFVGVLQMRNPGERSAAVMLLGILVMAFVLALLLGLSLGIAGLFQSDRRRVFAVAGVIVNAVIIVGIAGLMAFGYAVKKRRVGLGQTPTEKISACSTPSPTRVVGPVMRMAKSGEISMPI